LQDRGGAVWVKDMVSYRENETDFNQSRVLTLRADNLTTGQERAAQGVEHFGSTILSVVEQL
jgi:hypothetical protein